MNFLLVRNAHGLAGGRRAASFFFRRNAVYRAWAASVHDMLQTWALQRGIDLVVFSVPDARQEPHGEGRPPDGTAL